MGRLQKRYAALPTARVRNRVWARALKLNLLPDSDPARPYAHLICEALNNRRIEQGGRSFGDFFTDSRWIDWWGGGHPTPAKYNTIAKVVGGSHKWFEPHIAQNDEHPLHTLLYAMDLLGNPVNDFAAFEVLVNLQHKWGARMQPLEDFGWNGWASPQFPSIRLPDAVATVHYSSLAPASIIRHMLWIGNAVRVEQEPQLLGWVFDLVSAAVCVFAIYNVRSADAMMLSGEDGEVAAFVYRIFTRQHGDLSNVADADSLGRKVEGALSVVNQNGGVLPEDREFLELLKSAVALFINELSLYGFSAAEIRALDPCLYSSETAS